MNRLRISTILLVFLLLIPVFASCATQEAPQSDPLPATDQTQTDLQPVEQTTPETNLPYTFDTEQPHEIDLSIFTNNPIFSKNNLKKKNQTIMLIWNIFIIYSYTLFTNIKFNIFKK